MPPLSPGQMTSRFTLQNVAETVDVSTGAIVPTWSDVATVFGKRQAVGLAGQRLASEASAPRDQFDVVIRRRTVTLPLRLLDLRNGNAIAFAINQTPDDTFRDQLVLHCVDGLSFAHAETVTVYRGADTRQADGSTKRTWAAFATGVSIIIDDADAEQLVRDFGLETTAELRGTADIGTDVRLVDGISVTAGRHTGQRFLVDRRKIDPVLPAQAYWALALKRTTESFT